MHVSCVRGPRLLGTQQVTPTFGGAQLFSRLAVSSVDLVKMRFRLPSSCQKETLVLICYALDGRVCVSAQANIPAR